MAGMFSYRASIITCMVMSASFASAQSEADMVLNADYAYREGKQLFQDIYLTASSESQASVSLVLYRKEDKGDSSLIYRLEFRDIEIQQGAQRIKLPFNRASSSSYYVSPVFNKVMQKTQSLPPGIYSLSFAVKIGNNTESRTLLQQPDSNLSIYSPVKKSVNNILNPLGTSPLGKAANKGNAADKTASLFNRSDRKIEKYARKNGFTVQRGNTELTSYVDFYSEDWFIGRYSLNNNADARKQVEESQHGIENQIGNFADNQLENYQSLMSQFRKMKSGQKENNEMTGELGVAGNFSNGQEENSGWDNNFYELRGDLQFPIMDIPVSVSGYYTSQDKNREAKASFIRFSYDAAKAKEQLLKLIGAYNQKYEQTLTQGANLDMVYGSFVTQLEQEKANAIAELKRSAGLESMGDFSKEALEARLRENIAQAQQKITDSLSKLQDSVQTDSMVAGASDKIDDAKEKIAAAQQTVTDARQKATDTYQKAMDQYQRIQELELKINKYRNLLNQYSNTLLYDSLLAHEKIKGLRTGDEATYKDLAKSASSLLPEGKAKKLISGLTSFDAGMFPKFVSDYTQAGQMFKGADIGYDIGVAEVGVTYGKTEYIDRTGSVESYKAYGARAMLKPVMKQQFGLVYFGYSPSASLLQDNSFFKSSDVSLPSFRNPVHIISALYKGELSKYAFVSGEYAFSNKQGQSKEAASQIDQDDKAAYNIKVTGNIPETNINVEAGYEHAGNAFENNTLPVIMAGTDRIRVAGKGDFLRSFLTLGIEYNYMVQNSFYSKGSNSRWGFDIATHSKRFPSVFLSYKPFSTFRSYDDTLNIEQKPMLGSVWTGRANYQIKRQDKAIRFTFLYNLNSSSMDTVSYGSTLVQFSTILSDKSKMLSLNAGYTDVRSDDALPLSSAYAKSYFIGSTIGFPLMDNLIITAGTDLACNKSGLSRYSFMIGETYMFKKMPFTIRANFRYNNYKLDEMMGWKQLYSGGIELIYRIKMKLKD